MVVLSILTPDKNAFDQAADTIIRDLGPVKVELGPIAFGFTSYYDAEMGPGIQRWIWAFASLVDRSELARIKCLTNRVEQAHSLEGRRRFNLDPGLMTLGNFVLATGKDNAHRIYLGEGIFGDLTLIFRGGSYRPLEWTYPDYADAQMIRLLNELRQQYKEKLTQRTP
jgi:hypothetical protein